MLRTAAKELGALTAARSPYLADVLVSLVLTALSGETVEPPGRELTDRVMSYCLAHLSDPQLSSESVAHAHHISVRYLNRIMQPGGITVSAWIRTRRLERIRRDLADPAYAHRSAARIAADWGLLDAAHLSRSLRAEFGQSAAEIRRSRRDRPHAGLGSSAVPG
jgi:AraC-like DNA-binding protein